MKNPSLFIQMVYHHNGLVSKLVDNCTDLRVWFATLRLCYIQPPTQGISFSLIVTRGGFFPKERPWVRG